MTQPLSALVLDISRIVTRLAVGSESGVDRVERAYLRDLMARGADRPVFCLAKVLRGVAVLDMAGVADLLAQAAALRKAGPIDAPGHFARKQIPARRRIETAVRRLALGWDWTKRTAPLLRAHVPAGFTYINVGHSQLGPAHLTRIREGGAAQIAMMVHDVIPLDYPEYTRDGATQKFATMLRGAASAVDIVIYNSADTARRTEAWFTKWGLGPRGVTALLGVDPLPDPPARLSPTGRVSFVTLGTIEPRKNHLLLLSIWRQMYDTMPPDQIPELHIIGRLGWENENIIDVFERAPFMNRDVFSHGYLSDADMARRLGEARALLFPSFAEGFGYPLAEALQMGVPAICADLPVYRELAGDVPLYLDPLDGPGWKRAILSVSQGEPVVNECGASFDLPSWEDHFNEVYASIDLQD